MQVPPYQVGSFFFGVFQPMGVGSGDPWRGSAWERRSQRGDGQPKMSVICRAKGVTRRGTMTESRCTCEKAAQPREKLEGSAILESAHQCVHYQVLLPIYYTSRGARR